MPFMHYFSGTRTRTRTCTHKNRQREESMQDQIKTQICNRRSTNSLFNLASPCLTHVEDQHRQLLMFNTFLGLFQIYKKLYFVIWHMQGRHIKNNWRFTVKHESFRTNNIDQILKTQLSKYSIINVRPPKCVISYLFQKRVASPCYICASYQSPSLVLTPSLNLIPANLAKTRQQTWSWIGARKLASRELSHWNWGSTVYPTYQNMLN